MSSWSLFLSSPLSLSLCRAQAFAELAAAMVVILVTEVHVEAAEQSSMKMQGALEPSFDVLQS